MIKLVNQPAMMVLGSTLAPSRSQNPSNYGIFGDECVFANDLYRFAVSRAGKRNSEEVESILHNIRPVNSRLNVTRCDFGHGRTRPAVPDGNCRIAAIREVLQTHGASAGYNGKQMFDEYSHRSANSWGKHPSFFLSHLMAAPASRYRAKILGHEIKRFAELDACVTKLLSYCMRRLLLVSIGSQQAIIGLYELTKNPREDFAVKVRDLASNWLEEDATGRFCMLLNESSSEPSGNRRTCKYAATLDEAASLPLRCAPVTNDPLLQDDVDAPEWHEDPARLSAKKAKSLFYGVEDGANQTTQSDVVENVFLDESEPFGGNAFGPRRLLSARAALTLFMGRPKADTSTGSSTRDDRTHLALDAAPSEGSVTRTLPRGSDLRGVVLNSILNGREGS